LKQQRQSGLIRAKEKPVSSASTRSLYRAKEYATELFGVQPTGLAAKKTLIAAGLGYFCS
jgi:hypothetical protein